MSLDWVTGFGSIHDVTNDTGTNSGKTQITAFSLLFSFTWRVAEIWTLGARFPFTKASITGPQASNADDYSTFASGNLELFVRPSFQLTHRLRLPAQISLIFPSAQGDLFGDTTNDRVLPPRRWSTWPPRPPAAGGDRPLRPQALRHPRRRRHHLRHREHPRRRPAPAST